jgi:hypothetical protein
MHLKFLILLFALLLGGNGGAQNLIQNPSFEINNSPAWRYILTADIWDSGTNQEGYVIPTDGSKCAGLRFFSPIEDNWQEYLFQSVVGDLDSGFTYQVSFKYQLASRCNYTTDDLGVGFMKQPWNNYTEVENIITNMPATLRGPENVPLTNYGTWKEFSALYTADGTENFMAIGCFKKDATLSHILTDNPTNNPMPDIYFFIDEVRLVKCPPMPSSLLPQTLVICDENPVQINAAPDADSYLWNTGSTGDLTVVSGSNTFVSLEASYGACKMKDSLFFEYFSGPFELGEDILVCDKTDLPLEKTVAKTTGESVLWNTGSSETAITISAPGMYYVTKTREQCSWSDTLQVIDVPGSMALYPNPASDFVSCDHPSEVIIERIASSNGKLVSDQNIDLSTANELLFSTNSASYFVDIMLWGCKYRQALVIIRQ